MSEPFQLNNLWQWRPNEGFSLDVKLKHNEAAIIFPLNGPIITQVQQFIASKLNIEPDYLIITNVSHPDGPPQRLDPSQPQQWQDIITAFKETLTRLEERGQQAHPHLLQRPGRARLRIGGYRRLQPAQPPFLPV